MNKEFTQEDIYSAMAGSIESASRMERDLLILKDSGDERLIETCKKLIRYHKVIVAGCKALLQESGGHADER